MPNTLAHLGVQSVATRALIRDSDLKWIYLGCIVPDLPWILQHLVRITVPTSDIYDLRLYVIVQASLLFSILLSFALALLSIHFWKVFTVLSINSLFHLLLDACQTKWANGVHLLAPFNWHLTNFSLFWPESFVTYVLTGIGLVYVIVRWRDAVMQPVHVTWRTPQRLVGFFVLILGYITLPFFFLNGPENADNHFIKTLRDSDQRAGRYVEFDRDSYQNQGKHGILQTFAGEKLQVDGIRLSNAASVSARGTFDTKRRVRISEYHEHTGWIREGGSYLGLTLVVLLWIRTWIERRHQEQKSL